MRTRASPQHGQAFSASVTSITSRWRGNSPSAILLVQGIVEIIRCIICLKQGYWPSREQDVEEVDVDKLKEMVHVDEPPR